MKVSDFWSLLCGEFGYHFFTGVPNTSLASLFNSLNAKILHFVPAIDDAIAVDIAAGVCLCGDKAAVLCSPYTFKLGYAQITNFIIKNKVPVLFIIAIEDDFLGLKTFKLSDGDSGMRYAVKWCTDEKLPAVLLCEELTDD